MFSAVSIILVSNSSMNKFATTAESDPVGTPLTCFYLRSLYMKKVLLKKSLVSSTISLRSWYFLFIDFSVSSADTLVITTLKLTSESPVIPSTPFVRLFEAACVLNMRLHTLSAYDGRCLTWNLSSCYNGDPIEVTVDLSGMFVLWTFGKKLLILTYLSSILLIYDSRQNNYQRNSQYLQKQEKLFINYQDSPLTKQLILCYRKVSTMP